jgi:NADH dehydrogenase FAD-containing subunit
MHASAVASASAFVSSALAQPAVVSGATDLLPHGRSPRIVIAGGGWGGLTCARHLREQAPDAEVVVIERNPVFWSCPLSNKWLIDVVDTDYLLHDMIAPARRHGYRLVRSEITAIERDRKRVRTAHGAVDYDFLVVAGGIRNAYEVWFGNDVRAIEETRTAFPSAYIPNAEHVALKRKMRDFAGGTLVMTLPPPPHRCPPSPYERACLMAWYFKTKKIPARIVILDPKPRIAPIGAGFKEAFTELYPDIIQHVPNAGVKEVDPFNKVIRTTAGDFHFDDAVLMPPHQASDLVWQAGLIGKTADGRPTGWADIHPTLLTAAADPDVYVIGDAMGAVSKQFGHYPKSGHVANAMGRIAATYIAKRIAGKEMTPMLPDNLCYMLVNGDPREAISVQFDYELLADGTIKQTQLDVDLRTPDLLEEDFKWAKRMFADFLA